MRNFLIALLFFLAGIGCGRLSTQYKLYKAKQFTDKAAQLYARAFDLNEKIKKLQNEEQQAKRSNVRKDDSK